MHWAVKHSSGKLLDIDGLHKIQDLVDEYSGEADEGLAAAGKSSREDVVEWYIESQGEPIAVSLAATFGDTLLESLQKKSLKP